MLKFNLLCLLTILICACGQSEHRKRLVDRLDDSEGNRSSRRQSSSSGSSSSSNCYDHASFEFDNGFSFNPNASLRLSTSMNVTVNGSSRNTGYVDDAGGYNGNCIAGTYSFTFEHDGKNGLTPVRRIFRGTFYIDGKSDDYTIKLNGIFDNFSLEDRSFTIVVYGDGGVVSESSGSYSAYEK